LLDIFIHCEYNLFRAQGYDTGGVMKRKNHFNKSVFRSLALVTQFGINMLVPICFMSAIGIYLDRKWGTSYIMIILFFVGAIAGAQNVYRMARRIYDNKSSGKAKESKKTEESKGGRKDDIAGMAEK